MKKVLVLDPFRESDIDRFRQALGDDYYISCLGPRVDETNLRNELKDSVIVIGQPPLNMIQNPKKNCPELEFIQMSYAGTDMYTLGHQFPEGIILANGSGTYGMVMSQYVIGMILAVMLNFREYHDQQNNKIWERRGPIQSLDHAKVLIFGAGDIGTYVAKRLRGFDAYCVGVCQNTTRKREYFDELCTLTDAEKYISEADVIVCCIPCSEETAGYMDYRRLSMMKKDAVIVNVGRGNFIDCMALDGLLKDEKIWGAALDVTNPEPLPLDHPLWENKRCMITPHTSGATFGFLRETEELLCNIICDNLSRFCKNQEINNKVLPR